MRSLSGSWLDRAGLRPARFALARLRRAVGAGRTTHGSGGHVTVWTVVALVASMAATVTGLGAANRVLDVQDASSWLWSSHKGEIARVNAVTHKVDTRHRVVDAQGHTVVVTQTDRYLILRDLTNGRVTAIDLATLQTSGTRTTTAGKDISVALYRDTAFVIDSVRGTVTQVDPVSLATVGAPLTFPSGISHGAFDDDGILWIAAPSEGTVVAIRAGAKGAAPRIVRTVTVTDPNHDLVASVLDHGVAVLDQTSGDLLTVSRGAEPTTTPVPNEEPGLLPPRTTGSTVPVTAVEHRHVYAVRGERVRPDFSVPGSGHIAAAVVYGKRFYVFDEVARTIYVFDERGRPGRSLDVTRAGGSVELEVREGHLFINAPNSNAAWVVGSDGRPKLVDKYADNILGGDKPKAPPIVTAKKKTQPRIGPPGAPGSVSATAGNATARVSWRAAAANGSPITRYVVEGGPKLYTVGAAQRTLDVAGLNNGTEYRFAVHAVNARGEGPKRSANPVMPTADVPDPPGLPAAVANPDGSVSVSWPAADGQGRKITGYQVSAQSSSAQQVLGTTAATKLTIPAGPTGSNSQLIYGEQYTFKVVAVSSGAISKESAQSNTVIPFAKPGAPKGLDATTPKDTAGAIHVTWQAADENGRQILHYVVTANGQTTQTTGLSADVGGLGNNANVTVSVQAVNLAGSGEKASKTGVHTVAAPTVSITSVNASTSALTVNMTVQDGGGTPKCTVTVVAPNGSGHGGAGTGCGSITIGNLYADRPFNVTVEVSNVAGKGSGSRNGVKTDRIQGYVNCTDDPSRPPPANTYCQGNAGRNPGVGIYPVTSQNGNAAYSRNHVWIDAVCRASGQSVGSAWYNHNKGTSPWWVRLSDGNYIPFTWFNLGSSGGSGVGDSIDVLGDC